MTLIHLFIYFGFGLIVGSFLNAVIHRLWTGASIASDRSRCPHCKHVLSATDLIPVLSFVFLRGRCRYCKKNISWQYPIIELLSGLVFGLIGYKFGFVLSEPMLFALVSACFLIVIAVFDLKHYLILDKIIAPASIIALIHLVYQSVKLNNFGLHSPLVGGLIGVCIISGFFALQYYFSGGRWIGFGDVKLGIFLGLLFGVGQTIMLLFFSYCFGAVVGLGLIALGFKQLGSRMPFGTILGFCGIIMMFVGTNILHWYLKIIGF